MSNNLRADKRGAHRTEYAKNRKRILLSSNVCAICGKPIDKSLKFPHPMSATVDHIIPIDLGGHPSDISNLQLAHNACNRAKSNKIKKDDNLKCEIITNRDLPSTIDFGKYRG